MTTQLVTIESGNELAVLSTQKGIDSLLKRAKDAVKNSDGGDLKTKSGRAKIRSNAFQATKLKTSMEKEAVKLINVIEKNIAPELEKIVNIKKYSKELGLGLDKVRADTNAEVKVVEDELQLIEDEKIKQSELKVLAAKIESEHEIALLIDEKFERDLADEKARLEAEAIAETARLKQEQIDNDKRIAEDAAAKAKLQAEHLAQKEIDDAKAAEQKAIDDKTKADRELLESKAKQKQLEEQAKQDKLNQEWLDYISEAYDINDQLNTEAQFKQQQQEAETNRLTAIENERLAGIERQKVDQQKLDDEAVARAANTKHKAKINNQILKVLVDNGLTESDAKTTITLAAKKQLPNLTINY